jgi:outer membrane biosynthesis protein TonB
MAPRLRDSTSNSCDYPIDALRWGFEGWASNEISIRPDGDVAGVRTVMAYPPFVFSESAQRIGARNRYEATYVPDGQPCVTGWQRVVFALPE